MRVVCIYNYSTMDRRAFLKSAVAVGVPAVAVTTSSHGATGSVADDQTAPEQSTTIQRGRRIVQQAAYDDGSIPSNSPAYEQIAGKVDRETVETILASRVVTERLSERLQESDVAFDDLSVSKRYEDTEIQLFVEYPQDAADEWQALIETACEEFRSELAETHQSRLADRNLEIKHRQRPPSHPEYGCESTVGRFADAQYRDYGIAMGAAVRSETLGEIASSGFRGLREGHAVIVTTAHTFETDDDQEASELRGAELYQSRRPHAIGRCHAVGRDYGPGVDAAAVAVGPEEYPSRLLAEPGGDSYYDEPIVGTASWELLETHLAEDRPIYKQGAVTGRCEGRIIELREFSEGYRELDVDIHSDGGDSGGPYFVRGEEGLLVAAIHKGVRTNGSERRAIFVDSVCESLGIDLY